MIVFIQWLHHTHQQTLEHPAQARQSRPTSAAVMQESHLLTHGCWPGHRPTLLSLPSSNKLCLEPYTGDPTHSMNYHV